MDTERRVYISMLNDCYGSLLTSHQTEMIRLYFDLDVSLNEIASEYSISRQAVRDALQRGEKALYDFEAKLNIVKKNREISDGLEELLKTSSDADRDKIQHLIDIVEGD